MWEILFNLLKSDQAQIVAILIIFIALYFIGKALLAAKTSHAELQGIVVNMRDNHLAHIAKDIENVKEDVKSINEYLREKK